MRKTPGARWAAGCCGLAIASACAGGPSVRDRPRVDWAGLWPELTSRDAQVRESAARSGLFPVHAPTTEQYRELAEAERLYRVGDDAAFTAVRERVAADPVPAFWLARMLIGRAVFARDRARPDEQVLVAEPPWERPVRHLVDMGSRAAPCVVLDLLDHQQADRREFGVEVLTRMGPTALPSWQRVFHVEVPQVRRKALDVLAGWTEPAESSDAVERLLQEAVRDEDFGVRASAYRVLGRVGRAPEQQLIDALADERDAFVQRAIAESLARAHTREAAGALVDFMVRSLERSDVESVLAADASLRKMSGRRERGSVETWRRWLETWSPEDG